MKNKPFDIHALAERVVTGPRTADQHNIERFDLGRVINDMAEGYANMVRVGMDAEAGRIRPAINALEREFFAAQLDPETKMKTALSVAIMQVIALAPSAITDKVSEYANAKIKQDQFARHEGRPEHDMTAHSVPMKAGS